MPKRTKPLVLKVHTTVQLEENITPADLTAYVDRVKNDASGLGRAEIKVTLPQMSTTV